jgi:acetyltransferase-like isoleucine patch superfamily enzyme
MSNLKNTILNNPALYSIVTKLHNGYYFFSNSEVTKGKNSKIEICKGVLLKKVNILCKGKNNEVVIGKNTRLKNVKIEVTGNNNTITIGENVAFYEAGTFLISGDNCHITIGNKVTVGSASFHAGEGNTNISVGEDCMLSRDIKFATSDFHSIIDITTNTRINKAADVFVGNHVWIGNSVIMYKGSHVSDNSVVGIKAFVNKKFMEPNSLLAGQPAKIVKTDITWSREKL